MTIEELYEKLEELIDKGEGEQKVRLAFQPNWPLAFDLIGAISNEELDEDDEELDSGTENYLWLVASQGNCRDNPYAPRDLWDF